MISVEMESFLPRHAERGFCEINRPTAKAVAPCQSNTHTPMQTYACACTHKVTLSLYTHTQLHFKIQKPNVCFQKLGLKGKQKD